MITFLADLAIAACIACAGFAARGVVWMKCRPVKPRTWPKGEHPYPEVTP